MISTSARRLVLVRHGESSHVHRGGLLGAADVQRWRDAYDLAGISDRSAPPPALMRRVAEASGIIASDLPRAISSAQRLANGRSIATSSLLREIPIPIPDLSVRIPLAAWGAAMHLAWSYRIVRGRDATPEHLARVSAAASWLRDAIEPGVTIVVTHGVFRRLLGQELVRSGWTSEGRERGYAHWSAWTFAR
jgi:broad specificity phosphatase PhoE